MDPVTQTLLGAAVAQSVATRRLGRVAALIGAVAGELADADVFLGPLADPAVAFETHRHFTHSLLFVPIGGIVVAAPFLLAPRLRREAGMLYLAATLGYLSHGLIDLCTSYGTHWLWPLVPGRLALDFISIIDPVFTLVLVLGVAWALIARSARPAVIALLGAALYLGFGAFQHERATSAQEKIARQRGHEIERGRVMPTLGNLVLWRSVYEHEGTLWADAIRTPLLGAVRVKDGASSPRFAAAHLPTGGVDEAYVRDCFERFERFADGYVARTGDASDAVLLGDMRYSLETSGFAAIWGIAIDPTDALAPVRFVGFASDRPEAVRVMFDDVLRPGPAFRPLGEAESPAPREERDAVPIEPTDNPSRAGPDPEDRYR